MREGWEIRTLGEIATIYDHLRKPITKSDRKAGPYPYYGASGVQDHVEDYIFDGRYLLVGEDGAKWGPGDKSAYIVEGKCWVNNHAHILQLNGVKDTLVAYLFTFRDLGPYITGAIVPKMTQQALRSIPIPVPPIAEQEKIIAELDCLTDIIEKKKQQLEDLDKLAQSIFYDMFGDPIVNEKGWEVKKLGEIGKVITGNTPTTRDAENYSSNDYCFVKPGDIGKDTVEIIEQTEAHISTKAYLSSRRLPVGSVLTTCIGIVGKVGITKKEAICNQQINAILPNDGMSSTYVATAILLCRKVLEAMANAPVVPIINKGDFSSISIPFPTLDLQNKFAQKIEAIEKHKELVKRSIVETETLFNSRMDYWFN